MKKISESSINKILYASLAFLIWLIYMVLSNNLSLPVIGTDHLTGKCVWIETAPDFERRECPVELPTKYHPVPVRAYDATTSGHWGIGENHDK